MKFLITFYFILAVFRGPDPALPGSQVIQRAKGDFRRLKGLNITGKAKKAMSEQLKAAQKKHVTNALTIYHNSRSLLSNSSSNPIAPTDSPPPVKKRRLSADQHLSAASVSAQGLDQNVQPEETISRACLRKRKAM